MTDKGSGLGYDGDTRVVVAIAVVAEPQSEGKFSQLAVRPPSKAKAATNAQEQMGDSSAAYAAERWWCSAPGVIEGMCIATRSARLGVVRRVGDGPPTVTRRLVAGAGFMLVGRRDTAGVSGAR